MPDSTPEILLGDLMSQKALVGMRDGFGSQTCMPTKWSRWTWMATATRLKKFRLGRLVWVGFPMVGCWWCR